MRAAWRLGLLFPLLVVHLAACGDDSPGEGGEGTDTSAPGDAAGDAVQGGDSGHGGEDVGDTGTAADGEGPDLAHDVVTHHDATPDDPAADVDSDLQILPPDFGTLADPAPGEWPMFKRDQAHTGLADELDGAIQNGQCCVGWQRRVMAGGGRANGGVVIGRLGDRMVVFTAVAGYCENQAEDSCVGEPGTVYAIDGATGEVLWTGSSPTGSSFDPYGPLLADVDADGRRELVVPNDRYSMEQVTNTVYAFRTEDEDDGERGSIQWTFYYGGADEISEGAPTAANLYTGDDDLEIVIGSDNRAGAARFYVIDGGDGTLRGRPYEAARRSERDHDCRITDKVDSGSPALAEVGGETVIFGGGWDGFFYALAWRESPEPGLYLRDSWELPPSEYTCSIQKVRSSPVVGQVIPGGGLEVALGFMADIATLDVLADDFTTARLQVLSADGLDELARLDLHDWKSSPSLADLDPSRPGQELAGGSAEGVYSAAQEPAGTFEADWTVPTAGVSEVGNRSSPALADIDGDDALEVLIGVQGGARSGLLCLDGAGGGIEWRWDGTSAGGIAASPSVGDIDGDGQLEVVFLALDGVVYAIDSSCAEGAVACVAE